MAPPGIKKLTLTSRAPGPDETNTFEWVIGRYKDNVEYLKQNQ